MQPVWKRKLRRLVPILFEGRSAREEAVDVVVAIRIGSFALRSLAKEIIITKEAIAEVPPEEETRGNVFF